MSKSMIQLYNRVLVPESNARWTAKAEHITALNKEIQVLGYTLGRDVMDRLKKLSPAGFNSYRDSLLATLTDISGAGYHHQTLFRQFPYSTPDQHEYLWNRLIGYIQNELRLASNHFRTLSCGHTIDENLFDMDEFNMCPICQFQVDDLDTKAEARYDYKRISPFRVLNVATNSWMSKTGNALLVRNSSLSKMEREFLLELRDHKINLRKPDQCYRETLPFVYDFFGGDVKGLVKSCTDVMRIAYFLSNPNADLSLKENVKFKLRTSDRKKLLRLLDQIPNLTEDMMRNRERWLRLGEHVHVSPKYQNAFAAFQTLRKDQKSIPTFNRKVERAVRAKTVNKELLDTLKTRPGEFLRRIDFILRTTNRPNVALQAFAEACEGATTKMLLEVKKYLQHRGSASEDMRVFIPKGQMNKMQIVEDKREAIHGTVLNNAIKIIEAILLNRFSELPKLGKVYVDPNLSGIVLPYNRRGDSATTVNIVKGSRYPIGDAPVLRFFVHWVGGFDVDLSAVAYTSKFEHVEHIAFTNLAGHGAVHSGDVQNAPRGASEFIDIDIAKFISRGIRYVGMIVISYRGEGFHTFPCFAGFMSRDSLKSGQVYEPSSVDIKFDLKADTTQYLCLVFDLVDRKVIFADVTSGINRYGAVARSGTADKFLHTMKGVLSLPDRKPTVQDVLELHVKARGKLVHDPEKAKRVFTLANTDPTKIAEEFID